jgi:hypothetical protein
MRRLTGTLSPEDRRFYWKFVGGLFGFYAVLLVVTVAVVVGNHLSKNQALESAMAEAAGRKPPASIATPVYLKHAARFQ